MRTAPHLLLPSLALALVACGGSDRPGPSSTQSGAVSSAYAGPQALVLRIPRAGGLPRVFAYPKVDSAVWSSTDPAPTPARVLAFDEEGGSVAYEDTRSRPVLLDLRLGTISIASPRKLSGLASANGSAVFGLGVKGEVVRLTPTGEWSFTPSKQPKQIYPQPDGALLISTGTGANTQLLKMFPPDSTALEEIPFPVASHSLQSQLGDLLYLAVDSGLAVLRTRTMDWLPTVHLDEPIAVMETTPSGDRVFVLTDSRRRISVVDRFRSAVTAQFDMPDRVQDLRVDPFGRYLLVRAAESDSIWIVAIGTQRLIGGLRGQWRSDLPFVGYDGTVVIASGVDVLFFDGETLQQKARIRDGARDYWYPFLWDGFRPRAASLDVPVEFDSFAVDTTTLDTTGTIVEADPIADSTSAHGFVVSFAAFLTEDRARELASRIEVGGENARIVTGVRDGATIYRVILGPYLTRDEAERAGRESAQSYWVYEGIP